MKQTLISIRIVLFLSVCCAINSHAKTKTELFVSAGVGLTNVLTRLAKAFETTQPEVVSISRISQTIYPIFAFTRRQRGFQRIWLHDVKRLKERIEHAKYL